MTHYPLSGTVLIVKGLLTAGVKDEMLCKGMTRFSLIDFIKLWDYRLNVHVSQSVLSS